jgi:SAM-dependent methyltransferase
MMRSATELAIEHWNETPLYYSEERRYSTYPWLAEAAEFAGHREERVLEIGCGGGSDLLQFARHGAEAVGIDVTPEHVKLARRRVGQSARVLRADARALPFRDGSFDYVYSHGVLHHISEPQAVVAELLRVLRPSGRFNIHVYNRWSYLPLIARFKLGKDWKLHVENSSAPVYMDLYTVPKLRRLFHPISITVRKYQCEYAEWLGKYVGWFLVATGCNPPAPAA